MPPKRGAARYRFISIVPPWFDPPNILPYYGAIVLVIAGMGSMLAIHLAAPLRRLRRVVDRFGHGDLAARVGSSRRDEIGELSRAFDEMAGRIETLLAAERRLLQDVSHELRSPLARLEVAVELAGSSEDPGPSLGRIRRDIARLSVLVNELLQLTRAEGDRSALVLEQIRLDHRRRPSQPGQRGRGPGSGHRAALHRAAPGPDCSAPGRTRSASHDRAAKRPRHPRRRWVCAGSA